MRCNVFGNVSNCYDYTISPIWKRFNKNFNFYIDSYIFDNFKVYFLVVLHKNRNLYDSDSYFFLILLSCSSVVMVYFTIFVHLV